MQIPDRSESGGTVTNSRRTRVPGVSGAATACRGRLRDARRNSSVHRRLSAVGERRRGAGGDRGHGEDRGPGADPFRQRVRDAEGGDVGEAEGDRQARAAADGPTGARSRPPQAARKRPPSSRRPLYLAIAKPPTRPVATTGAVGGVGIAAILAGPPSGRRRTGNASSRGRPAVEKRMRIHASSATGHRAGRPDPARPPHGGGHPRRARRLRHPADPRQAPTLLPMPGCGIAGFAVILVTALLQLAQPADRLGPGRGVARRLRRRC